MKQNILVVDDDADIRSTLQMLLRYEGYEVRVAEDGQTALKSLEEKTAALVLLDIKMPGRDGLEILPEILSRHPQTQVVMISGHGDIQTAVEAIKKGAMDFLEKPLDGSRTLVRVRTCFERRALQKENQTLRGQFDRDFRILGESPLMKKVLSQIEKLASSEARVLIQGENGTGKELVARQIHLQSARHTETWIALNCAAIPKELIESELFGHEKGSFTGANARKLGQFELASGGTLFLDEIGELDLAAQAKLLRVLEQGEILRVGGDEAIAVDVRVIAATNKDLKAEIAAKNFREDLFYRLNVVSIHLPSLRERKDDIALLAKNFLSLACQRAKIDNKELSSTAISFLQSYSWPGNVRQLKNWMERVAVMGSGKTIGEEELREWVDASSSKPTGDLFQSESFEEFKDLSEAAFLRKKLEEYGWNIKRTAEKLKMQRSNLYKKLEKYGLK